MNTLQSRIEQAYDRRADFHPEATPADVKVAIDEVMTQLNAGTLRVAEKIQGDWVTHDWIKKAVLLLFRTRANTYMPNAGLAPFFDKVPLKFAAYTQADFEQSGVRVVPPAYVRDGVFIGAKTVLMPSYINIGAYVDEGSMIDTWATVGSCAQIGKNVHLSGGVGIGGVLEPLQATPTIIEDNCFIGARSEVVEGVIVEEGAVISMGVYLGQSTPIYDRRTKTISYGRVPKGAVVIPGALPAQDGSYSRYAAIIVKQVDEKTRGKVSINELLRGEYSTAQT